MAGCKLVCVAVVFALFSACEGKGSGAPTSACITMMPRHNNSYGNATEFVAAQTSDSPYSIVVSQNNYTSGKTITVQIIGPVFKGFLLQARQTGAGKTTPIGTFSNPPTDTKSIMCTTAYSAMTHANKNPKNNITLTWNPPSTGMGNVQFVATVAREKVEYWTNIRSSVVMQASGAILSKPPYYVIMLCLIQSAYIMLK